MRSTVLPDTPPPSSNPLLAPPLWRRLACWLYEGVLLFGVVFISSYLFSTLTQTRNALDNRHAQQGFLFLVLGLYFVWFWTKGQTLAMKTWHIRLVDHLGHAVPTWRAVLRYVLSWVWFLPPLVVAGTGALPASEAIVLALGWIAVWAVLTRFHPQRQFWHDAWAGTRLITDTRPAPGRATE